MSAVSCAGWLARPRVVRRSFKTVCSVAAGELAFAAAWASDRVSAGEPALQLLGAGPSSARALACGRLFVYARSAMVAAATADRMPSAVRRRAGGAAGAEVAGLDRAAGTDTVTDELVGAVMATARPSRAYGHGAAWEALIGQGEQIRAWID